MGNYNYTGNRIHEDDSLKEMSCKRVFYYVVQLGNLLKSYDLPSYF